MRRLVLALLLLLGLPAAAEAGTVRVVNSPSCHHNQDCPVAIFEAGPGEANDVRTEPGPPGSYRQVVRDVGATVTPGAGCDRVDDHTAICVALSVDGIALGDGDDRGAASRVLGGPGNDVVEASSHGFGGPGNDIVSCSRPSDCWLDGGSGADRVTGGPGEDHISGGPGGAGDDDLLDGGEGTDILDCAEHTAGVEVDLASTPQRYESRGEQDSITRLEVPHGGDGDDVLGESEDFVSGTFWSRTRGGGGDDRILVRTNVGARGGAGDDTITATSTHDIPLHGGTGDDRIEGGSGENYVTGGPGSDAVWGGGGRDEILGGGGRDLLRGGAGRDWIGAAEARKRTERAAEDRVDCGPGGRDRVLADPLDRIAGCERVRRWGPRSP